MTKRQNDRESTETIKWNASNWPLTLHSKLSLLTLTLKFSTFHNRFSFIRSCVQQSAKTNRQISINRHKSVGSQSKVSCSCIRLLFGLRQHMCTAHTNHMKTNKNRPQENRNEWKFWSSVWHSQWIIMSRSVTNFTFIFDCYRLLGSHRFFFCLHVDLENVENEFPNTEICRKFTRRGDWTDTQTKWSLRRREFAI